WTLFWKSPEIDPDDLAHAVEERVAAGDMDYRVRLLVRDSVEALKDYWGAPRFEGWLAQSPVRERIEAIRREEFERPGFPMLKECLVEKTDPQQVRQFFETLGSKLRLRQRLRIAVGGSIALIMPGYLARSTTDIDVVNELPPELRSQHALLDE